MAHTESVRIVTSDGSFAWIITVITTETGRTGLSVLEPLLALAPVVMAVWDTGLKSVWLNEEAIRLQGVFPYLKIGTQLPEDPGVDAPVPVELIRRVLDDGVPVMDRESPCVSGDGIDERTYSTFLFRVEGVDSRPLGVCLLAIDITHSRARERLALLREASVKIGTTLERRESDLTEGMARLSAALTQSVGPRTPCPQP